MQYKDTSQQAFLISYLICILSFIYFLLGRSRWVGLPAPVQIVLELPTITAF